MELIHKQIAKLDSITNCPVCGSPRSYTLGGRKGRKLFFLCGSLFFCHPGAPIGALIPCPRPSETAADLLNLEIVQADHTDRMQAGAA